MFNCTVNMTKFVKKNGECNVKTISKRHVLKYMQLSCKSLVFSQVYWNIKCKGGLHYLKFGTVFLFLTSFIFINFNMFSRYVSATETINCIGYELYKLIKKPSFKQTLNVKFLFKGLSSLYNFD